MSTKRIDIRSCIRHANAQKIVHFRGSAYIEAGFLKGFMMHESGDISKDEEMLLTAFTLTGCPLAAHVRGNGDINPWVWTNGAYRGRRIIKSSDFTARSELISQSGPECLKMDLTVDIVGILPELFGVARPFQERITEQSPGHLSGIFPITFRGKDREIHCKAETEYELKTSRSAPTVFRNITITTAEESSQLLQIEQIDLFDNPAQAAQDLQERLAVHI
jgi:hypothetical protein